MFFFKFDLLRSGPVLYFYKFLGIPQFCHLCLDCWLFWCYPVLLSKINTCCYKSGPLIWLRKPCSYLLPSQCILLKGILKRHIKFYYDFNQQVSNHDFNMSSPQSGGRSPVPRHIEFLLRDGRLSLWSKCASADSLMLYS